MLKEFLRDYNVILASKSPRRHLLLKGLDIDFEIRDSNVSEEWPSQMHAADIPEYLAELKSNHLKDSIKENEILITADTAVILGNEILNKPGDNQEAESMLNKLSGRTHRVITGVCLTLNEKQILFKDETIVHFRDLDSREISYYLSNYEPFDKAGSYGAQEWIGYIGIERLEGSYFNVMGLPVRLVYKNLLKLIVK